MSKETEKVMKDLSKFLEMNVQEGSSTEEMNNLVQEFMDTYKATPHEITEENAETSDDYMELAERARTKAEAIKYLKKAIELDESNIDARVMLEEMLIHRPYEMINKYAELIEYAKDVMSKKGYMDEESIGHYWGIVETRPFIRLCFSYMELLTECGMMRQAAKIGEEILRYNENDNVGARYRLMHIYAYLEEETKMTELHQHYEEYDDTQMLLPLSIAYFKLGQWKKAEEYLVRLKKANKDTAIFFRSILNDTMEKYFEQMDSIGYRPSTIEEFLVEFNENSFLFENSIGYFDWALTKLKKK